MKQPNKNRRWSQQLQDLIDLIYRSELIKAKLKIAEENAKYDLDIQSQDVRDFAKDYFDNVKIKPKLHQSESSNTYSSTTKSKTTSTVKTKASTSTKKNSHSYKKNSHSYKNL